MTSNVPSGPSFPGGPSSLREIFLAARKINEADERDRFIRNCCGADQQLLRSVHDLLRSDGYDANRLDRMLSELGAARTIADSSPTGSDNSEVLPRQIGGYTLIEKLGEGGMGNVYRAQQLHPVRRDVALKLIKPGMDSKQVIARFEVERQAMAMMDHPYIAKVFEAANSELGQPYFVMELVEGKPITAYCDAHRLRISERLNLFIKVCRAVQHAHRRGIIHRDLKPSNILVCDQDGQPSPKVIDFGIAKATQQSLTDLTLVTGQTQLLGTPMYMSPEQADSRGMDIDTRTDVYALGVVLYEILTGKPPFDKQRLHKASYWELRRVLSEDDPPPPSSRLSGLSTEDKTALAEYRQIGYQQLQRRMRGDLDWIVMKALEKDRRRRYESAHDLASDIERYLSDLPVSAKPPSWSYQFSKFAKRRKGLLISGITIAVTLITGLIISLWLATEARRAQRLADDRLTMSREALATTEGLRIQAELARNQTQELLYISDMQLASNAFSEGDIPRVVRLLDRHAQTGDQIDRRGFEWHYLSRLVDISSVWSHRLPGQAHSVAISPDREFAAVSSGPSGLLVFDCHSRMMVYRDEDQQGINSLCWSRDSAQIYAGCEDGRIVSWQRHTHQKVSSTKVESFFPSPDKPQSPKVLDDFTTSHAWQAHDDEVNVVHCDPVRQVLWSGSDDLRIRAWEIGSYDQIVEFVGHGRSVEDISLSHDGKYILSSSNDERVRMWEIDARNDPQIWTYPNAGRVVTVSWAPNSDFFVSGDINGNLHLVDPFKKTSQIIQQTDGIESLVFVSPDGQLAVGDRGGVLHFYHCQRNQDGQLEFERTGERRWQAHQGRVEALDVDVERGELWSGSRDGELAVWSLNVPSQGRLLGHAVDFDLIAQDRLVAANADELLSVSLNRQSLPFFLSEDTETWGFISCDPSRQWLVHLNSTGVAWSKAESPLINQQHFPLSGNPHAVAISPGGSWIAVAWWDQRSHIQLLSTAEPMKLTNLQAFQCYTMAFSPDGKLLAAGSLNDVLVFSLDGEQPLLRLAGHDSTLSHLAFSPDGRLLATVGHDRRLKTWEIPSGKLLATVEAHPMRIQSVAFSSDGSRIATGGEDNTIRLWHSKTLQPVLEIKTIRRVDKIRFSSDDHSLIALLSNLSIYQWSINP